MRELPACWLKLNNAGKLSSNLAATEIKLRSPPILPVWRPGAHVRLSGIWCRFSRRLTGENGFEPIKPVPAIWSATLGICESNVALRRPKLYWPTLTMPLGKLLVGGTPQRRALNSVLAQRESLLCPLGLS